MNFYKGFFTILDGYKGWSFKRSLDFYCVTTGLHKTKK